MSAKQSDVQLQGVTDLSLIAAVKPGFVNAFETISHVARLRNVLKTLNGLRLAARESANPRSPYTDVVSRFRIVHSFRWVIIEPKPGGAEPHQLLLSVCFDGGWEPYMRVIWDELGSMLDLILCHCEGYPLARAHSFERYIEWVRAHELADDFLFIASGRTVSDHEYLALLEQRQRQNPDFGALDALRLRAPASGSSERPLPPPGSAEAQAMALRGLPALSALYALERYFLPGAPDGACLLRAARDILYELAALDTTRQFPPEHPARQAYHRVLGWFEDQDRAAAPKPTPRQLGYDPADIQAGMLTSYPALKAGALVLLRIVNRAQAIAWLNGWQLGSEAKPGPIKGFYRNVALSLAGLRALGLPAARLARFPQAFREGMETRAGLLGDLRHNHPAHWKLPERNWPRPSGRSVDLASVHLVVQLRHDAKTSEQQLDRAIEELQLNSGLQVLSVQKLRRNSNASGATEESFGFVDGISQPVAGADADPVWSDAVPRGELLLGYPTSREPHYAVPEQADALLDKGTFMVVRKLRQHVPRFNAVIEREARRLGLPAAVLKAKLMGRQLAGEPLADPAVGVGNRFNYKADAQGSACPFHAHIRRANPRGDEEGKTRTPRLLRRGMSYGPAWSGAADDDADRGLVFMAYNASLAEQFETLQRWLTGANSSGGYSGQPDPFMAVVEKGQPRIYRFEHEGRAIALDLGDEPFVELQWGAYFFVPSIAALRNLPALLDLPLPAQPVPPPQMPAPDDAKAWQQWLEDGDKRDLAWAWVRAQPGGVVRTAYGVLVGDAARVMEVFRDPSERYSVSGYGERMQRSVGLGFLGMDDDGGHRQQAPAVNAVLEGVGEEQAFGAAYAIAKAVLTRLREAATRQIPLTRQMEAPLDLEQLSEQVLAALCTQWFGLPDGKAMLGTEYHAPGTPEPPRCPHGFFSVSRYVFGPHPSAIVERVGAGEGQALLQAVRDWLASGAAQPALTARIVKALTPLAAAMADPDLIARTLTGVMLGFPPTVHGNLLSSLGAWVATRKLWDLQQDWPTMPPADAAQAYNQALSVLRPTLIATMLMRPTPAMVWRRARSAHRLGQVEVTVGDTLVVGIASATQQNPGDHYPIFGGDRRDPVAPAPLHACPGYAMAMGVMLGITAALLEAGNLRPTASPLALSLQLY
jgi:Dyp-type peroxidase family